MTGKIQLYTFGLRQISLKIGFSERCRKTASLNTHIESCTTIIVTVPYSQGPKLGQQVQMMTEIIRKVNSRIENKWKEQSITA